MKSKVVLEKFKNLLNLEEEYSLQSLQNILKQAHYITLNDEFLCLDEKNISETNLFSRSL